MTTDLAHRASRGIVVTMGGLWGRALLQMVSTMVLARLLTPADFGLVAMITSIVGIADLVRDFGMTGAVIQAQDLSERVWRSVLWLSVAVGIVLAIIISACAPLIADLYDEPRLIALTLVMAPGLLLNGIMMPLQARATREMRFSSLAAIDVFSMLAGVVTAIVTAAIGWGVWSLIAMAGATATVRFVWLWRMVRPQYGRPRIDREVWPLVSIGGSIFGAELLGYAEKNSDNVIVGATLGPAVLGQYSRAYALFLLPLQQLNAPLGRVALPILSSLREEPERYRRYLRSAVLVIGYLTLPTYAIAAGVAGPLVSVLLGPGWELASVLFSLLAIAGFAQAIGRVRTWVYISLGRSHRQFLYDLVARPIVIVGFLVGATLWGVQGMVIVYGVLSLVLLVPGFAWAISGSAVRGGDIAYPVVRPFLMALLTLSGSWFASRIWDLPDLVQVVLGGLGGVALGALLFLLPAYRRDARTLAGLVAKIRKPVAADAAAPSTPATPANPTANAADEGA